MGRLYSTSRREEPGGEEPGGEEQGRVEGAMVASIAAAAKQPAGSVGVVEAQHLDLPRPVQLDCGRELHPVRVAYETYGTLNPLG